MTEYNRPKPTGERAFYDLHKPETVDRRDHPGDNEHKADYVPFYKRKRQGYNPGEDEKAAFPSGPDQTSQGRPGYTKTSVPTPTVVMPGYNEHLQVEEMHSIMAHTTRANLCRADVVQRQIGGYLARLVMDGSPDDMKKLVAELQEQVEVIDGATVTLLQIDEKPTWNQTAYSSSPIVGWIRCMRPIKENR
jgi:hypothetical protein